VKRSDRRVRARPRLAAAPLILAIAVLGCSQVGTPSPPVVTASMSPSPEATTTPRPTATPRPSPSPTEEPGPSNTPFTVLILGADRERRTDVVMIAGIDPIAKTLSFASIPRDTINLPLPDGGTFKNQKINTFYNYAAAHPDAYPQGPGRATADVVETLLGIRIDYYAMTTFTGFKNIVKAMGGVEVVLPSAVVDPYYEVSTGRYGVSFPAGEQVLTPARALIFVRTRKADNDFERQRRQQLFLTAAARQVLADPGVWLAMLGAAENLETDFPLTAGLGLIDVLGSVDDMAIRKVVLGPRTYASSASCPCGYALAPDVDAMRGAAADLFPYAVPPDP
jgi:LCP family protein required for cell wall assembly